MSARSIVEQAAALAAAHHKVKVPLIVDHAKAHDAESGRPIHCVTIVNTADPDGPAYSVIVDAHGQLLAATRTLERLFQPDTNVWRLNPGDVIDEAITVTIPKHAGADAIWRTSRDHDGCSCGTQCADRAGAAVS
jgi:hypothetical protein